MKRFQPVCFICAAALCVSLAGCSFFKGDSAESAASSAAASASSEEQAASAVSKYGKAEDFDYANFAYSDSFDEKGYWDGIRALDFVTLPDDYTAIPASSADLEPTDDDVQAQIDSLLSQNAATVQVTDREAADGDTVNIDYSGSVDGVVFNGGTAEGYDLALGSGSFIDDFEQQIEGHKPGDTFDVTVTFPEGYSASTDADGNTVELSGKEAVFSVTLNYISETVTPELTDEWVDGSYGQSDDLHTVEQLREYFRGLLYENNLQKHVMDYLLENSTFTELPQQVTNYQVMQCLSYYNSMAGYYGYTLDDFVKNVMGYASADALLATMDDNIETYSKEALIYQAVAEDANVEPTQEQIDAYSDFVESYGANYCRMIAMMDAVTNKLTESAVVS